MMSEDPAVAVRFASFGWMFLAWALMMALIGGGVIVVASFAAIG